MPRKRAKFLETRIFGFVIALAVALVFAGLNYGTRVLESADLKTLDLHFFLKAEKSPKTVQEGTVVAAANPKVSEAIRIIGVDFDTLSAYGQWPFPRTRHADLLNAISRIKDQTQRENSVLLDFFFVEKHGDPASPVLSEEDQALVDALASAKNAFLEVPLSAEPNTSESSEEMTAREERLYSRLGTLTNIKGPWQDMGAYFSSEPPIAEYSDALVGFGHPNFSPDRDQTIRRQPMVAKESLLLETIDFADLKPGYAVNEAACERLAWMDKDGRFHNIQTPLTEKSLAGLANSLAKSAPPVSAADTATADGLPHYTIRKFKDRFIPSITLALSLHYFGKTMQDVEVVLGDHVRIPSPTIFDVESGTRQPYQLETKPAVIDKDGNVVKEAKKRPVPYIDIPINANGEMLINFMGIPSKESPTFAYRSYNQLADRAPPSADPATWTRRSFAMGNQILMVGAYAKGMAADEKPTPYGLMYGIEVHANALNTILMDNFIHRAPVWLDLLVLLLVVALVALLSSRFSTVISFFVTIVILLGFFFGLNGLFDWKGLLLNFSMPAISMLITFVGIVVYRAMTEERDKKKMRETFGKYVSPLLVDQLADNPPELGGIDKELTVFFSDIRGFTSISENMTPQELINHLNEYLTAMTDILLDYGGTLDKYMGDAIMGFWGAPLPQPDHALLACKCALKQMEKLHELNKTWPEAKRLDIGIGLNTGKMTVGNMGSPLRLSYTLAGDNVNLGSRLEGTNKAYGTNIIISEYTYGLVRDKVIARELDNIRVKGKNKPVLIYELIDVVDGLDAPRLSQTKGKK